MARAQSLRLLAALLAFAILLSPATSALAADGDCAPGAICFPAGTACATFDLQVQLGGSRHGVYQEFLAEDGMIVHVLGAASENTLTFTNLTSGAKLAFIPPGSLVHIMLNPDDTRTEVATGHSIIVLSPLHAPAGPSAMLYEGRVTYVVAPGEIFTLWDANGNATDICAALATP